MIHPQSYLIEGVFHIIVRICNGAYLFQKKKKILLLTALKAELLPILKKLSLFTKSIGNLNSFQDCQLIPSVIGVGPENARTQTARLIKKYTPDIIVLAGISGGLAPDLESGNIIIPKTLIKLGSHAITLQRHPAIQTFIQNQTENKINTDVITITTSDILANPERKLQVYEKHLAQAVDMESYDVVAVSNAKQVPIIVIRSISDTFEDHLLEDAFTWVNPSTGEQKAIRAVWHLLRNPSHLSDLLYMKKNFDIAISSLSNAVKNVLDNINNEAH